MLPHTAWKNSTTLHCVVFGGGNRFRTMMQMLIKVSPPHIYNVCAKILKLHKVLA
jgi:hypothetical protein